MQQVPNTAPVRGALFYSTCLLLLGTVGAGFQRSLGLTGIVLTQVLLFLGLAVLFVSMFEHRPHKEVFRLRRLTGGEVLQTLALGVCSWALIQVLGYIMLELVERSGGKMPTLYVDLASTPFALALVTRALLPAVCEETAFRGYLQWALGPLGRRAAVILTALLFGAMHGSLLRLVPLALLGLIFAEAVERTGSLYTSMLLHFTNNAIALSLSYFLKTDSGGAPMGLPLLVAAAVALGVVVWLVLRSMGRRAPSGEAPERDHLWQKVIPAMVISLLPGLLIYAFAASSEIVTTFLPK